MRLMNDSTSNGTRYSLNNCKEIVHVIIATHVGRMQAFVRKRDYNFLNDKFDRSGKNSYLIKVAKIELKLS